MPARGDTPDRNQLTPCLCSQLPLPTVRSLALGSAELLAKPLLLPQTAAAAHTDGKDHGECQELSPHEKQL